MSDTKKRWLSGERIDPEPICKGLAVSDLIDSTFLAYNAGRLKTAARLYVEKMLDGENRVGLSLSGALTPAGLGRSVLIHCIPRGNGATGTRRGKGDFVACPHAAAGSVIRHCRCRAHREFQATVAFP